MKGGEDQGKYGKFCKNSDIRDKVLRGGDEWQTKASWKKGEEKDDDDV